MLHGEIWSSGPAALVIGIEYGAASVSSVPMYASTSGCAAAYRAFAFSRAASHEPRSSLPPSRSSYTTGMPHTRCPASSSRILMAFTIESLWPTEEPLRVRLDTILT